MKKVLLALILLSLIPAAVSAQTPAKKISPKIVSPKTQIYKNQKYLENFIDAVKRRNVGNPNLPLIEQEIRKQAATTTDMVALFIKKANAAKPLYKKQSTNPLLSLFVALSLPENVYAEGSLTSPFGGPILFTTICPCSGTWLVFVGPTMNPSTSLKLLDYVEGTQGFESYTLPFSPWVLGEYIPSVPMCFWPGTPCYPTYTDGAITPLTGSAPL